MSLLAPLSLSPLFLLSPRVWRRGGGCIEYCIPCFVGPRSHGLVDEFLLSSKEDGRPRRSTYISVSIYIYKYIYTHLYIYTKVCVCIYIPRQQYIPIYICKYVCVYVPMYIDKVCVCVFLPRQQSIYISIYLYI